MLVDATKILGRSQEFLNDAALDLESLKCNDIQNQSKLLAFQEELGVFISPDHSKVERGEKRGR